MAGITVAVTVDGVAIGETTADAGGQWTLALDVASKLANGSHQATATARNSYGGVSPPSAPVGFVVEALGLRVTCGCGTSPGGGSVLLAVALMLLGSRRRHSA
jgi:MYXO-CTERM domain-containing protein